MTFTALLICTFSYQSLLCTIGTLWLELNSPGVHITGQFLGALFSDIDGDKFAAIHIAEWDYADRPCCYCHRCYSA